MTNFEFYKDEIKKVDYNFGFTPNGGVSFCGMTICDRCIFHKGKDCAVEQAKWLYEEYKPQVKVGDIVEYEGKTGVIVEAEDNNWYKIVFKGDGFGTWSCVNGNSEIVSRSLRIVPINEQSPQELMVAEAVRGWRRK